MDQAVVYTYDGIFLNPFIDNRLCVFLTEFGIRFKGRV